MEKCLLLLENYEKSPLKKIASYVPFLYLCSLTNDGEDIPPAQNLFNGYVSK